MADPKSDASPAQPSPWMGYVLAFVVLAASLLLVLGYWRNAQQRGLRDAEVDFRNDNRQLASLLQQRLINFELLARGGASVQTSLPRPSRLLWQRYVAGLDLERRFPSVQALGFALDVPPGRLAAMREVLPRALAPAPADGADDGSGARADDGSAAPRRHAVVLYAAPAQGADATGADLAANAGRRAALVSAAESGELRASAPVAPLLPVRARQVRDFALFVPVHGVGESQTAGAPGLRGWVFVEIRADLFVREALRSLEERSRLRVSDATGGDELLYADPDFGAGHGDADRSPAFVDRIEIPVAGRQWRIEFESEPLEQVRERIPGLYLTLLTGLLGALVLFAIAFGMARTQSRAQALAVRMSDSSRRSEQRFRSAMQYSAIGKALLDRDGRILEANPALAQILRIDQEALAGSLLGQHFVDADHDGMRTAQREVLEAGAYRVTRRLRRSDGDVRHASLTFAAVPSDVGEDFVSLVQVEDVTERQRAEARVQALNRTLEARVSLRTRELSHANRELESFAYSVSHDLRAPLRSIDGFSRILGERYAEALDDSGRDYLQRIRAASVRMSELIDALLKMSRLSRGDMKLADVDLSAMARDAVAELRNGDPAREVAVEIAAGLTARGDPALLRNLLDNLLGNAWKFTRGRLDARIAFGRNRDGEYFVRDNGAGFAPDYADKLFRPFQRLHSEAEYAGHGIGLASVKRIVERHGGSIRAEGEVDRGATFFFRLGEHPAE